MRSLSEGLTFTLLLPQPGTWASGSGSGRSGHPCTAQPLCVRPHSHTGSAVSIHLSSVCRADSPSSSSPPPQPQPGCRSASLLTRRFHQPLKGSLSGLEPWASSFGRVLKHYSRICPFILFLLRVFVFFQSNRSFFVVMLSNNYSNFP